jgi:hypothetical protein
MHEEPMTGEVLDSMPAIQPQAATALATAQDNPYMRMAEMALSKGAVDQLDKLLDLQLRWDAEQQRKAFVAAMSAFKLEAGGLTIAKSKRVSFTTAKGKTEYDHAELHDITRALVPVMAKHGLSHRWTVSQQGNAITVECVVSHRDGHSERVAMTAPPDDSGGKNSIQAIASSKSYLERYTLLAATGIATGGEIDTDGHAPVATTMEFITEEQEKILRDLVDAYIQNEPKFMDWIRGATKDKGVQVLADIQAQHFDLVHAQLGRIRKQKEQADA